MKKLLLFPLVLLTACTNSTLRPQINGRVYDQNSRTPISGVAVYSYDGEQLLSRTDKHGLFTIAAITKTRIVIPGDEKEQLGPHAFDFVLKHKAYTSDTLKVTVKIDNKPVQTDTIYLKSL